MERIAVAIPVGTFEGFIRHSARFKRDVPGILVTGRSDIEIHPADWARQLDGCIATGESIDSEQAFADSNNTAAFLRLMALLPPHFTVVVS